MSILGPNMYILGANIHCRC